MYRKVEREERCELLLQEVAEKLGVAPSPGRKLIRSGALAARQACKGAPWLIREQDLDSPQVREQLGGWLAHPRQTTLDFD